MADESPAQGSESDEENNVGTKNIHIRQPHCVMLPVDVHIRAYLEKKQVEREIQPLKCSGDLIEKVIMNYIIVKQILSSLSWQDKMLCKEVCTLWRSAVQALRREQLSPVDFIMDLRSQSLIWAIVKRSNRYNNEPLTVMAFINGSGLSMTCQCNLIEPRPCNKPCINDHSLLDTIQKATCAPKDCMSIVRSDHLAYMPLPNSITFRHTRANLVRVYPYMIGLFIPVIPDVMCHTINIKSIANMQTEFHDVVLEISKERIFKGIFVYVTDKYLLHSVEDIIFLNHFKDVQPDIPYALGGCIIEDTIFEQKDIKNIVKGINEYKDFYSENLVSISMFTVPKNPQSNEYNFDMFSLVLDSSYWTKTTIQDAIIEFSKRVPQFEYSVVIKLSCVGRDQKHKWEQECFRSAFPNTRLVGCYGNGELGIDHPPKPPDDSPSDAKRTRRDAGPQFGIMYSYSTVFVYMGWGRITVKVPT